MSLSLRRSCHACTKSKRRCIPQLPRCDRCAQKQIPCVYDLEPVSQGETLPAGQQDLGGSRGGSGRTQQHVDAQTNVGEQETSDFKIVYSSVKSAREASMIAFANGHDAASDATRPKMFGSAELTQWVVNFFIEVVRDGAAGRGTPFAHRHIFESRLGNNVSDDEEITTTKTESFTRLLEIHNLTIRVLTLLLSKTTNKSDPSLDSLVTTLFTTAHALWSSPPPNFDPALFTPWQAWLTAESIRRSMFAAQLIKGLHSFFQHGYVTYEPFFESFPFDPRAGLWEARTEEEWGIVLRRHGGEHVKLKSFNEFIVGTEGRNGSGDGGSLDPNEDGSFQRLLFLCFHCDTGLKYIRELGELQVLIGDV